MSTITRSPLPASPSPAPPLTAEEFVQHFAGQRVELVKGLVKELPMPSPKHGKMCGFIAYLLTDFALKHDCAHVMTNDSFIKTRSKW